VAEPMGRECCGTLPAAPHEPWCDVANFRAEAPPHPLVRERDRYRQRLLALEDRLLTKQEAEWALNALDVCERVAMTFAGRPPTDGAERFKAKLRRLTEGSDQ